MAFTPKHVVGLFHLTVLLLSSFTVLSHTNYAKPPHYAPVGSPKPHQGGHHHPKPHPLSPPPVKPPTPPPHKPPTQPPVKPPVSPPPAKSPVPPPKYPVPVRKLVAVKGVVYCKSCKYFGIDNLTGAKRLANATVRIVCTNTKYHLIQEAKTDKNGNFLILPQRLTTSGSHKCKVFLVKSPSAKCKLPSNLHAGRKGAILIPPRLKPTLPISPKFQIYTVGPFAFEAPKKCY